MSKYIDADFLKSVLRKKAKQEMNMTTMPYSWSVAYECFAESIDAIPEADVEPVRHGHWILTQQISENAFRYNCSKCNRWVQDGAGKNPSDRYPYCHCGAKMDGKENKE